MWCIAELDQAYIQKMEDVLAIYEKPYNPAQPVVCLDEKPISLHADVRTPIPAKPGTVAKQDNEYQRCGTANVLGVVEPKGGRHFTTATPNRSGAEFARMVDHVVEQYPAADTIHLVMDKGQSETDQDQLAVHEKEGHRQPNRLISNEASASCAQEPAQQTPNRIQESFAVETGTLRARQTARSKLNLCRTDSSHLFRRSET
jgi:hypothetical protein